MLLPRQRCRVQRAPAEASRQHRIGQALASTMRTSGIQCLFLRARRDSTSSPSKSAAERRRRAGSTFWNALTLTTAYSRPSSSQVTMGTTPQREHTWKVAVLVPKLYFDTSAAWVTWTVTADPAFDVHTPPCLRQKEQEHARAGISAGSPGHSSAKVMLPQWQPPLMITQTRTSVSAHRSRTRAAGCRTCAHSLSRPR